MKRIYTPRPEWVDKATPGTVLVSPTGDMRVIRRVSSGKHWRHPIFSFAIRRCSWTRRPYTIYTWGELVRMGYTALDVTVPLDRRFDKLLEKNIVNHNCRTLFCCDVVGVTP